MHCWAAALLMSLAWDDESSVALLLLGGCTDSGLKRKLYMLATDHTQHPLGQEKDRMDDE